MRSFDDLKRKSRGAGLRLTEHRLCVLRVLHRARVPMSQPEVAARIGEMDRTTLFRNLRSLVNAGLVRQLDLGDRTWRFELITRRASVDAVFTCTSCGTEVELHGVRLVVGSGQRVPGAVKGLQVKVQLNGTCDACA